MEIDLWQFQHSSEINGKTSIKQEMYSMGIEHVEMEHSGEKSYENQNSHPMKIIQGH